MRARLLMTLAPALLAGCVAHSEMGRPDEPFRGPVPVRTATPADDALRCLARQPEVQQSGIMFAVHVIKDRTNKFVSEEDGGVVPSDVAGMLVTSLQKAGVNQVNRANTAVTEWEIARAKEQILGDGQRVRVGDKAVPFRPVVKGSLRGSDIVIDGAITQLDYNTYSNGIEAGVAGFGAGARQFALTVATDLRVTDTRSTEILLAKTYSKVAVGTEVYADVFRFFGSNLFDVRIGDKSQEGLHAGIRWLLAEAAYDIVVQMTDHDGSCNAELPETSRQIRAERDGNGHVSPDGDTAVPEDQVLENGEDGKDTSSDGASVPTDPAIGQTVTVRLPDGEVTRTTLTPDLYKRGSWNKSRTVFIVTR